MEGENDSMLDPQPHCRLEFGHDDHLVDDRSIDAIHARIPKEVIPVLGMEFETEDDAYNFYNAYALRVGFSTRRSKSHSHHGRLLDRLFVCSCEGKRTRDKRHNAYKTQRPESRMCCLASLKINCRQSGTYRVVKFIAEHNHYLASPKKAHLLRSHRNVSSSQASEIDMVDQSRIAPRNSYEFIAKQAGGRECLGFAHMDNKNCLPNKRSLKVKVGEIGGVLEYLQNMQLEDPGFFYAIQVDKDDMVTNIFWADAKMMADYDDFGDVVCFDTTYRKYKDGRPIALFVGVNHHKQTIIFGVALLYDETAPTFVWLFNTFSKCMAGKLPKTILTEQDAAITNALASRWADTYHRLCVWHIFQDATIHLSNVFSEFKGFLIDFGNCVYDYEHEKDFLDAWDKMLIKYDLQNNDWLRMIFSIKEKWALVYGRDTFCADMTTTQRSDSMNKVIKHYANYRHDLRRFFENFHRILNDRRHDEMVADLKANQKKLLLPFPVEILKYAANVYTPEVFKFFQLELSKAYDCNIEVCGEIETVVKYTVTPYGVSHSYDVSYDTSDEAILCTCGKFQFDGMLCCHALKVFSIRGIMKVPDKYILKRWTKNAKNGSIGTIERVSDMDPKAMIGGRYKDLCRLSTRLNTRVAESEEAYTFVREGILKLLREIDLNDKSIQPHLEKSLTQRSSQTSRPEPSIVYSAQQSTFLLRSLPPQDMITQQSTLVPLSQQLQVSHQIQSHGHADSGSSYNTEFL